MKQMERYNEREISIDKMVYTYSKKLWFLYKESERNMLSHFEWCKPTWPIWIYHVKVEEDCSTSSNSSGHSPLPRNGITAKISGLQWCMEISNGCSTTWWELATIHSKKSKKWRSTNLVQNNLPKITSSIHWRNQEHMNAKEVPKLN